MVLELCILPLMDSKAINSAEKAYLRCLESYERCHKAVFLDEILSCWEDFCQQSWKIFEKLHQGSRKNPKSKSAMDRVKGYRKKDELLNYIHHCRNCDNHGLEELIGGDPREYMIPAGGSVTVSENRNTGETHFKNNSNEPSSISIRRIMVVGKIANQYGDEFPPPTFHNDIPIWDHRPISLMTMSLLTLKQIIFDAKKLPRDELNPLV